MTAPPCARSPKIRAGQGRRRIGDMGKRLYVWVVGALGVKTLVEITQGEPPADIADEYPTAQIYTPQTTGTSTAINSGIAYTTNSNR